MPAAGLTKEDDWDGHPELRRRVEWRTGRPKENPDREVVYHAQVGAEVWLVRVNDFPEEPLYTLLIDGAETIHFNDWPPFWERPD